MSAPPIILPPQHQQNQPGDEFMMQPQPESAYRLKAPGTRLSQKVALITGGDSGIGRAVAVAFAREGATIAIIYLEEHEDAVETQRMVREAGGDCLLYPGDIGSEKFCRDTIKGVIDQCSKLDMLVNNGAQQYPVDSIEKIPAEEVAMFGSNVPMEHPGQPDEVAPSFVFLASEGASYMTGQVLHPNSGEIVNG